MEFLGDAKVRLSESWAQYPWTTSLTLGSLLFGLFSIITTIYRIWFHPLAKFPGPKTLASTGFIVQWRTHISGNFVREVARLHRRYGNIVRVGPNHLALDGSIGWPQVYAHKGADHPEPQKVRGFFHPDDHLGLIAADRDNHRRQRRILAHAFSDTALIEQESIILQYINTFIDRLSASAKEGKMVNIVDMLNFLTFDIIGDLTFGESFGGLQRNDYHPWVRFILEGVQNVGALRLAVFYPIFLPFLPFVFGKKFMDSAVAADKLSESKAAARIQRGEKEGRRDFMTYMTKKDNSGQSIAYREQIVNSPLLIGAGSETTATALSGLFFYMGQEPKLLKKLAQEVRASFKDESEIDLRSTAKLVYLHACIEETLRIYPPAAETSPRVSPGMEIEGTWIPRGTLLSVHQWATHRNPENFAHPDSFRPERWLPETHELYDEVFAKDNRSVFKPFSHGPRNCIGKTLAYAEMRTIMCRILFRFDVELGEGQKDWHEKQLSYIVWVKGPLPPDGGGLLELGSIISSIAAADEPPLNEDCRIHIAEPDLFCSHQRGFTATISKMRSGELGMMAKLVGLQGVGGGVSWASGNNLENIYRIKRLDTLYFTPSQQYIAESMLQPDVKDYVIGTGYKPVYMVTGLKIARGGAVSVSKGRTGEVSAEVGVDLTAIGAPVEVGPTIGTTWEKTSEMAFADSTDFIVGIRVKKLVYKRPWLLSTRRELTAKDHNKGATLVDDDLTDASREEEVLELADEAVDEEAEVVIEEDLDGVAVVTTWIV
ncbi:Cytochrome P450 monooxygenase astJ [Paramyrothecium foliicola]|nr:Cytochrome P450 monooxygenase astJ [Paramyrothecium foliicola]